MTVDAWLQIVAAVLAGNLLTMVFGYALIRVRGNDLKGHHLWSSVNPLARIAWTMPLLFLAFAVMTLDTVFAEEEPPAIQAD